MKKPSGTIFITSLLALGGGHGLYRNAWEKNNKHHVIEYVGYSLITCI